MDDVRKVLGSRRALIGLGGASAAAALAALATPGEAQADEAFNQQIASALGFWPAYQEDPPTITTKYGVPVVWISTSATLVDKPTLPIVPSFDNGASSYTIPSTVGVDYYVGSNRKTAGTYVSGPDTTVTVNAVATAGYIIPGRARWRWSFPDPMATTVVTSDGFSGPDASTVVGRAADLAAGGSAATWKAGWQDPASWGVSNEKLRYRGTAGAVTLPGGSGTNFRLEWDITRYENVPHMMLIVAVAGLASGDAGLYVANTVADTRIYTGSGQIVGTAPPLAIGHHALQYYDRTATFESPAGTFTYDLTPYNAADQGTFGSAATVRAGDPDAAGTVAIELDNLVLKKVGW